MNDGVTKKIINKITMEEMVLVTYSNSNENVAKQFSKMTTENIKMRLILFHFVLGIQVFRKRNFPHNQISPNVLINR